MKTQNQKNQNRKTKIVTLALQAAFALSCMLGFDMTARASDIPSAITDGTSNTILFPEIVRGGIRPVDNQALCEALRAREGRTNPIRRVGDLGRFIPDDRPEINCPEEEEAAPLPSPTPEAAPIVPQEQDETAPEQIVDAGIELPVNPNALAGGACSLAVGSQSSGALISILMTLPLLSLRRSKSKK